MNISNALNNIASPYLIDGTNLEVGATYDYAACRSIEEYLAHKDYSYAVSYCDYAVTGRIIEGVMTVTCVGDDCRPQIFPIIYWRNNG